MKLKLSYIWMGFLVLWVGIFVFIGWHNLDPDFGWHVQMGNYIARYGIPKTDPFSYTMPSYAFIDHEWLTNRLMAEILNNWGYMAEAVIFGLLAGGLFWLLVPKGKQIWAIVPLLFAAGVWVCRGGVRPQILDWIFLAGLLRLVWNEEIWKKWRWGVVPMFGLWANLHGGFAIGPVVLLAILVFKNLEIKKVKKTNPKLLIGSLVFAVKKVDWTDVWVWIAGVVATWVNPYGLRIWYEVWMQITDSNLKWNIAEWQPFWVRAELGIWLLVGLTASLARMNKQKIDNWKVGVAVCLLVAGMSSLRHMALLAVMLVFLATELVEKMAYTIKKDKIAWERAKKFYLLIVVIATVVFLEEVGIFVSKSGKGQGGIVYPTKAVEFLRKQNYPGQMFSEYGWGGYLIWKYPEKRVYMDGRMPSWRWTAPKEESNWAFKDYIKIKERGEFAQEFAKYDIRVVLWTKHSLIGETPQQNQGWWAKFMRTGLGKESVDLKQKLEEAEWNRVYEDEVAVVYVRR